MVVRSGARELGQSAVGVLRKGWSVSTVTLSHFRSSRVILVFKNSKKRFACSKHRRKATTLRHPQLRNHLAFLRLFLTYPLPPTLRPPLPRLLSIAYSSTFLARNNSLHTSSSSKNKFGIGRGKGDRLVRAFGMLS